MNPRLLVELRPVGFAVTYRMLGSVSEAEDGHQGRLTGQPYAHRPWPTASPATMGAWYQGWRLMSIDGFPVMPG